MEGGDEKQAAQQAVSDRLNPLATYVKERHGKRVIQKVLIANNGMAATKAIMSMRRWTFVEFGSEHILTFVAMATQDDLNANAEFIRLADTFVEVPSGKNVNNYANVELICKIAQEQGVDAVWPGWGHASENPKLPSTLKEMGITFIGPTSSVMSALGDKIAANILAQTAKVPSIPWSGDGLVAELTAEGTIPEETFMKAMVNTVEEAVERAGKIGYPVMVKASEGGGGKGIRKAANAEELKVAFTNVQAEVPGSPIFMMQLCSEARHLEVQILGDEYGNTLALNGRDCSTQRRFQKIFEEGPPIIATAATFKEMERAAQRLTALVGYRGAGTVEYLYNAQRDNFYFLELNPRLQVEHPVTEGITGVNLPATQLQVAMGIPLYNIPDIRRFYGLDPADTKAIDFMTTDYPPIQVHVMASRITAENPDEGFKPTSGKINSVRFQSSGDCWGYFSVGLKGGIHEFADSQFGHIFAKGPNRKDARKALLFALKNIDINGDIRHPVDYLCDLLQREDFMENRIDTMWLDRLIAEKLIAPNRGTLDVVFFATVYRAYELVKKRTQDLVSSLQKGRLVLLGKSDTDALISFPLAIVFSGYKYSFHVARSRADTFVFTIGSTSIKAKVREQPDGSLYVSVGNTNQVLKGMEEALGLRLMIGATTVMVPEVYDPSELRSDVNGKVVRYLHDEGAEVSKGEPYIELEAMKMIMALKSTEGGKISHAKSAGSIVSAGELLARLELKDPSKVQKIEPFEGAFSCLGGAQVDPEPAEEDLSALLEGYEVGCSGPLLVERTFEAFTGPEMAAQSVKGLLEKYLANERSFTASMLAQQPYDGLLRELITEGKDSLDKVIMMAVAHNKLEKRHEIIMATIREMVAAEGSGMSCMYVPDMHMEGDMDKGVYQKIVELSQLPTVASQAGDYGNVRYLAQQLLDVATSESYEDRVKAFRAEIDGSAALKPGDQATELGCVHDGGLDLELMVELLSDDSPTVQDKAIRTYLHWLSMPFEVTELNVTKKDDLGGAVWTQHYPVPQPEVHERKGVMVIVPDIARLEGAINVKTLGPMISASASAAGPMVAEAGAARSDVPLNLLHVVVGRDAFPGNADRTRFYNSDGQLATLLKQCAEAFAQKADILRAAGVGEICVVLPQPPRHPRFAMFIISAESEEWTENKLGRDMWPSFVNLLELNRLKRAYTLQRIHKEVRPTSHIYLATQPSLGGHKAPPPELFMRGLYYSPIDKSSFGECVSDCLLVAMEEVEHAMLDPLVAKYGPTVTSRIYLHFMQKVAMEPDEIQQLFKQTVNSFVGQHGSDMLKLCTDEIEVKIRRSEGQGVETLRLSSSSLGGGYMKMNMLREFPDPVTGNPTRWENFTREAEQLQTTSSRSAALSEVQAKRVAARRAGSMYAYDLCGLMKVALSMKWRSMKADTGMSPASSSSDLSANPRRRSPSPSRRSSRVSMKDRSRSTDELSKIAEGKALPEDLLQGVEMVMDWDRMELVETERGEGFNDVGMLAWRVALKTLEYPQGRDVILIANDVTFQAGSFGVREDQFFQKASEFARRRGIPRIYVSCNSGARVGLVEELKPLYKVHWIDASDPGKGFEYLYLTKADYEKLPPGTVQVHSTKEGGEERFVIDAIIGLGQKSTAGGIGVENLQGSAMIAGETSRAYQETFTLSYITGRSVGIGAYLNRLGQRNIQMVSSPMILTGYSALNKLLGKNVYTSQDQLGGPQIMVPNGVTHQVVRDDQEGMSAILDWLSYVPKDIYSLPPMHEPALCTDPWNRDVEFAPTKQPYDPRDFLRGTITTDGMRLRGFFDTGSFTEYLEGWGRTVVVGRARLGGVPMGVIAVETRSVERFVPADPANPESCEVVEPQAGQVWFPDSAFKTAQALRDFNRAENLPVMIFANWRGFSGGTRDMYSEILKYGAQIVDALVEYEHPIFIYIPPNGELRGGAWVVIDPQINPEKMEMYADVESRGGILEPPGIVEVKYRTAQQVEAMHRHDDKLKSLAAEAAKAEGPEKKRLEQEVKARERQLLPLYTSIAVTFADLHDRAGRMKAKGVIREGVEWKNSRRYFYWRVRRRVLQDNFIRKLQEADKRFDHSAARDYVRKWAEEGKVNFEDDQAMVGWLESQDVSSKAEVCKVAYLRSQIQSMFSQLPEAEQKSMMAEATSQAPGSPSRREGGEDKGGCSTM